MKFAISVLIFVLTLICVIFKPFNKKDYFYVLIFSVISILFSTVNLGDCLFVVKNIWNAVFSLISIMIISSILDEAGFLNGQHTPWYFHQKAEAEYCLFQLYFWEQS